MKKFKNKFIFTIIFFIIVLLGLETYYFLNNDTNTYVSLISGTGYLNKNLLEIRKNELVHNGDIIKTVGEKSLIVVQWGDNSITRLGGNSEILINENYVSRDLTKMQISFDLVNGRTWTKLVSLFGKGSYFKENVDNIEAGVRGTVFEVNKEKDYIFVVDHEISLKNQVNGKELIIGKENPVSLSTFSLIDLQFYFNNLKDKAWDELNKKLDNELIKELNSALNIIHENNPIDSLLGLFSTKYSIINSINSGESIDEIKTKINSLNSSDKKVIFDKIYSKYQKLNFLQTSDQNYKEKLYYKDILLQTSYDKENTVGLVKNTLYDINEMVLSNTLINLDDSINILTKNKDSIKNLNIDFKSYINLSLVPASLKDNLIKILNPLNEIFKIDINMDSIKNLDQTSKVAVNSFLDNSLGWIIDIFKALTK